MLEIEELMINMCDFKGTVCENEFDARWKSVTKKAENIGNKKVDGVYLGFEFCPNMLSRCDITKVVDQIQRIHEEGLTVTWVIPPLYERHLERYKSFLQILLRDAAIDECVVNDFGTLHLLRKELQWKKTIIMGRLFDKSVREFRVDVKQYEEIKRNEEAFQRPGFCSEKMQMFAQLYEVHQFETDTIPNSVLNLEEWTRKMKISVHYPRILLSRAAYCEFDGVNVEKEQKFLLRTSCGGVCDTYEKVIHGEPEREIYKAGLAIMGFQKQPLEESVRGRIRMVYSEG